MTKPKTNPDPTPNILGEVVEMLQDMTPREVDVMAVECNVTSMTVRNIKSGRNGPNGPTYFLVERLHRYLKKRQVEKTG